MIIVLNFGSQFAHLIARRVRDMGVSAEVVPWNISAKKVQELAPAGIIFSGGPSSVLEKGSPKPDPKIYALGIPILGICYGLQTIGQMLGGKVTPGKHREFGKETLRISSKTGVLKGLSFRETVWFSHGDQVTKLPRGFTATASTVSCKFAGFADAKRKIHAILFHPEVTHTKHGRPC